MARLGGFSLPFKVLDVLGVPATGTGRYKLLRSARARRGRGAVSGVGEFERVLEIAEPVAAALMLRKWARWSSRSRMAAACTSSPARSSVQSPRPGRASLSLVRYLSTSCGSKETFSGVSGNSRAGEANP